MMKKYLFVLFQFFTTILGAYQYEISVCAIFQNEAPYLKEWIEYHRMLGAQHFYLYNNSSNDNYLDVLSYYIDNKIVTLIDWPSPLDKDWTPHQIKAYNDCIEKVKNITKWLAIIDIDEFIVPITYKNLSKMLRHYRGIGGLQIFWQFFGTSKTCEIPKDKTLIEALTRKARRDHDWNYNFKTICRPSAVRKFFVHGAKYHSPWFAIFPHHTRGGAQQPINIDIVRIHHYWTRDEKYFREQKIPRRERFEKIPYTEEKIQELMHALDQEEDLSILRFVNPLKKRLSNLDH
jgi:Glycosyltransferase family 92